MTNFVAKIAQIFGPFWGYFEKHDIKVKMSVFGQHLEVFGPPIVVYVIRLFQRKSRKCTIPPLTESTRMAILKAINSFRV